LDRIVCEQMMMMVQSMRAHFLQAVYNSRLPVQGWLRRRYILHVELHCFLQIRLRYLLLSPIEARHTSSAIHATSVLCCSIQTVWRDDTHDNSLGCTSMNVRDCTYIIQNQWRASSVLLACTPSMVSTARRSSGLPHAKLRKRGLSLIIE
jgi:hypothetical protein